MEGSRNVRGRWVALAGMTLATATVGLTSTSVVGLPSVLSSLDDEVGESDVTISEGDIDLATVATEGTIGVDGTIGFGVEVVTWEDPAVSDDWTRDATRLEFHIDTAPTPGAERVAALFHDGSGISGAVFDRWDNQLCSASPLSLEVVSGHSVWFDPLCLGNVETFGWWVEFHYDDGTTVQVDRALNDGVTGPVDNPAYVPVKCRGRLATIVGTPSSDTILGTAGADVIAARGGADTVNARSGNDVVCLGRGNDQGSGGGGSDVIDGGPGRDVLAGAKGNDRLLGGPGKDTAAGGPGRDTVRGGSQDDVLRGDAGRDTVHGQGGSDTVRGNAGDDGLSGGRGADRLFGGPGDDLCNGGPGVDTAAGCEPPLLDIP